MKAFKEYFVLRASLFYSLFIIHDLISRHGEKGFDFVYNYILNTFFIYGMFKLFSFSRIIFLFSTFVLFSITYLLVFYQIVDKVDLDANLFEAIFKASKNELSNFVNFRSVYILLSCILFWVVALYPAIKHKLRQNFSMKNLIISILVFSIGVKNPTISKSLTHHTRTYPSILDYYFFKKYLKRKYLNEGVKKDYSSLVNRTNKKPLITVLYVGESARGDHFSNNDYFRNTSDNLKHLKNFFSFGIVKSCDTLTTTSVPCMLSSKTSDSSLKERYSELGISHLFTNKGFKGHFIGSKIGFVLAPEFELSPNMSHNLVESKISDSNYKDIFTTFQKKLKQKTSEREFFLIRNEGSHFSYSHDISKQAQRFEPVCEGMYFQCSKQALINSYDNTIYYTSLIISNIIKDLSQDNRPALFMYSSDHGESLGENGYHLHGNKSMENRMVELFIYVNDGYKKAYPQKYKALVKNTKLFKDQLTHNIIWHSLLDGSGFVNKKGKFPIKKELSIFSDQLQVELKKDWYKTDYKRF